MKVNIITKTFKALFTFNDFCESISEYVVDHINGTLLYSIAVVLAAYAILFIKHTI